MTLSTPKTTAHLLPNHPGNTTASRIAALLTPFLGTPLPLQIRAWDGSQYGPDDAPTVVLRSRRALRRLLWNPGELGLADAYITGELDIDGDLADSLHRIRHTLAQRGAPLTPSPAEQARSALRAVRLGALGPRPAPPRGRASLTGTLHSKDRDQAAIHHHYDLSNDFYKRLLDPSMAYSCAYWTSESSDYTLADAQQDKLDLICQKLALTPGARLLDIGCGWGSLALHAARHYGTHVTAVTLSAQQHTYVTARAQQLGMTAQVEVLLQDYRDIIASGFDAVSTVEMGEHVGDAEYPAFTRALHDRIRPGGKLLIQQMSRRQAAGGGAFIETYIAPDMHMRPLGETIALIEEAGLEVHHVESVRHHYARTCTAWHSTLEENWEQFTDLVGEETTRVWRLYLVGAAQAFREHRMGIDQIVATRPTPNGASTLPITPHTWYHPATGSHA